MRLSALFALAAACTAAPAFAESPLEPFHAVYATARNGDEVGRTELALAPTGDGSWTLRSETHGTSGLAKLAGIHIVETSRFRWVDGRPEALVYDYVQEGGFKQRTRHASFDWQRASAQVSEGGKDYHYATAPGLIDRQSVTLAIAADLARGAKTFDYHVAVKDRIEDMRYAAAPKAPIDVPAGRYDAVLVQRDGEPAADRKRVSRSWFAGSIGWMPVQIEQSEKNGDTITLKLVSIGR